VVVLGEDTPDQVLIDIHSERFVDLLCDSKTAETRVTLLEFNNRLDKFR